MAKHILTLLRNRLSCRCEPFSLVHFVTARCNARCAHCFIDFEASPDHASELTLPEIRLLTAHMGGALYNVNLTGGEPFLREDLFEIVACYTANTPVRSIVITSNGWFTTAVKRLVESYARLDTPCRLTLSFSIDQTARKHDDGRNLAGLHAHALESYHFAAASSDPRITADIALTVTPDNAGDLDAVVNDLRQSGVARISPILLREEGVLGTIADKPALAEAYLRLSRMTERLSSAPSSLPEAIHRAKNHLVHRQMYIYAQNPQFISPCRAGSLFGSIGADGTVATCELLAREMPLGNLRDYGMNFLRLWNDKPARAARDRIRATRCHCSFECAWTVNMLTTPARWPALLVKTARELL